MSAYTVIYFASQKGLRKKKSHPHASEATLRGEPCCRFIIHNSSELMQYSHDN